MTPQEFKIQRKQLLAEVRHHRNCVKQLLDSIRRLEEKAFCPKNDKCQYNDVTHGCQKCHPTSFSTDPKQIRQLYESNWGSDWVDDGV